MVYCSKDKQQRDLYHFVLSQIPVQVDAKPTENHLSHIFHYMLKTGDL